MIKLPVPLLAKEYCISYLFSKNEEQLDTQIFSNLHYEVMSVLRRRFGITSYGEDRISSEIHERFGFEPVFEVHFHGYMSEGRDIEIILEYNLLQYTEEFDQIFGLTYEGENKYFSV